MYQPQPDPAKTAALAKAINVNTHLAALLVQRGIETFEQAKNFFNPLTSHLHDPMQMRHMDLAVQRLAAALQAQEPIMLYGDYDVDGTTAVALMHYGLRQLYALQHKATSNQAPPEVALPEVAPPKVAPPEPPLHYYVPNRLTEGYGLSAQGVQHAHEQRCQLLITLDCGINAVSTIEQARQLGIDTIVVDHHLPGPEMPPALAILDPNQPGCHYPCKHLSGCGVAFKLLYALYQHLGHDPRQLHEHLDLLAISIGADIVPVTGENRILAFHGLQALAHTQKPGLVALKAVAGLSGMLDMEQVVFGLAPRINAVGRLAHARQVVQWLLSQDAQEAQALAAQMDRLNQERRALDAQTTAEALQMVPQEPTHHSTVLFKEEWSKGVVGIVASRCIEQHYRPTIILAGNDAQTATGSARSIEGLDIHQAIKACQPLLQKFGGHAHAAGLTLNKNLINTFKAQFDQQVATMLKGRRPLPQLTVHATVQASKLGPRFMGILERMGPFGPGHEAPVLALESPRLVPGSLRLLKEKHLRFAIAPTAGSQITAIGFGLGHYYGFLQQHAPKRMAFTLQWNVYQGNKTLQLNLKDIRFD